MLDGEDVPFEPGDTVLQAATRAGRYIPHLCWHPDFPPHGSCRLCSVKVNGRAGAACTLPASAGLEVESNTAELNAHRKTLLQMLFVEGNHFCPSCEKSGNCLLQATAYEMGMDGPHFEEFYPDRPVDASHPDMLLDLNRCILCELCVRASRDVDGKNVFAIGGPRHRHAPDRQRRQRPAGRHRLGAGRPRGQHLPGRRDPAQAARLRGADRASGASTSTPVSDEPEARSGHESTTSTAARHRARSRSPPCRWPAASAATCRFLDIDERLFELLEHVRVRPLAAHRHQAAAAPATSA